MTVLVILFVIKLYFQISIFKSLLKFLSKLFNRELKNWKLSIKITLLLLLTLFRMGFLRAAHGWGRGFLGPLPKIRHTCPTIMKLGTVIPYLRKIQKMYKSRDTSLEVCWHHHFFTGNQKILLHQEIHI